MNQRQQDRSFQEIRPGELLDQVLIALGLSASAAKPSTGLDLGGSVLVDLDAIVPWLLAGVELFGRRAMSLADTKRRAAGVVAVLAMARTRGNLTRASKSLGVSRRCLRETLKAAGRYPWNATETDGQRT